MSLNYSGGSYKIYTQNANDRLTEKPYYSTMTTTNDLQTVRYFSGTDVDLYFGNFHVGEAAYISYSLSQSTMAIFGYNSYVFDDIAQGSRLIQGKFMINFVKSSYLYDILNTLVELESQNKIYVSKNYPLWNKSIDLYISYGNAKQDKPTKGSQLIKISKAYLTACEQSIAPDGKTVVEVYDFIARDIDFNASNLSSSITADDILGDSSAITELENPLSIESASLSLDNKKLNILFSQNIDINELQIKTPNNTIYYATNYQVLQPNEINITPGSELLKTLKDFDDYEQQHIQLLISYQDAKGIYHSDISLMSELKQ